MILDTLGAIGCGLIAMCCFWVFSISRKDRKNWRNLPWNLRYTMFGVGIAMTFRSLNLLDPRVSDTATGHLNGWGLITNVWLLAFFISLTVYLANEFLPGLGWDRLRYVFQAERHNPRAVPVMMDIDDVVEAHGVMGVAAIKPMANPEDVAAAVTKRRRA